MRNMSEKKRILFGDIIVLDGKNKVKIKNAVFKEGDLFYKKNKIIDIISFKNVPPSILINAPGTP